MKRAGFTMIELIFVIVILGILAAVAVPKLSATRDDANIAKALTEVSTAVNDFGSYYTSQGSYGTVSQMTNVIISGDGNMSNNVKYVIGGVDCVDFNSTAAALADGNFSVSLVSTTTGSLCDKVQKVLSAKDLNRTHSFGGQKVQF